MKKHLLIVLLCLLLAVSACGKTEIRPAADESASEAEAQTLLFETTDLNGNAVSGEELFSSHKITMVNVMTTWCTYCIQELPELQELSDSYASRDCAVVGLLYDGTDEALIETGRTLMEEGGASYTVLCPWEGMEAQIPVQAFPTTFFVNSDGQIVGQTVVGADIEGYQTQLDALLSAADE